MGLVYRHALGLVDRLVLSLDNVQLSQLDKDGAHGLVLLLGSALSFQQGMELEHVLSLDSGRFSRLGRVEVRILSLELGYQHEHEQGNV